MRLPDFAGESRPMLPEEPAVAAVALHNCSWRRERFCSAACSVFQPQPTQAGFEVMTPLPMRTGVR